MRPLKDRITGLWKWGQSGLPKYHNKKECEEKELELLTHHLEQIRKECRSTKIQQSS